MKKKKRAADKKAKQAEQQQHQQQLGQQQQARGQQLQPSDEEMDRFRLMKLREHFVGLGKDEWWWIMDQSMEEIGRQLTKNFYCCVDNFLTPDQLALLQTDVKGLEDRELLKVS